MRKSCMTLWVLLAGFLLFSPPCQAEPENDDLSLQMKERFVIASPFTPSIESPDESKNINEASIHENGDVSDVPLPKPPPWFLTHPPRLFSALTPELGENKTASANPCNNDCQPRKVAPKKTYSPDPCKNACYLKLDTCQLESGISPRQECNDKFMACLRVCFKRK